MSQKLNPALTLGQAARQRVLDHIHNTAKALPASIKSVKGSIVTVNFESGGGYNLPNVTIPHFGPEYIRYPTQQGDRGVVIAMDSIISNMDGLGPSAAPGLSRPGNLSPLVFLPIANQNWFGVDGNKITHYGKNGFLWGDQQFNYAHGADTQKGQGGFAYGKPQNNFSPSNVDLTQFSHYSVATAAGLTHSTTKDHAVNAGGKSNVTAQTSHNINAPSTNLKGADGSSNTSLNVQGSGSFSQTLQAALGQFGGLSGSGGGSIPGNLGMGGNISAGGNMAATGQLSGAQLQITGEIQLKYAYSTPTTGSTVSLLTGVPMNFLNPAASLSTLTLAVPSPVDDGAIVCVAITRAVTTLTCSGGSFGPNNPTSAPAAGAQWRWQFLQGPGLWLLF